VPEYQSKEEAYGAIERMVAGLQANEELKARIPLSGVSVGFRLTDLDARFVLELSRDQISGGPGDPAECSVGVSLSSRTFDEMFSGRLDPESAYMFGSLTLRGSEYEAQRLLPYMPQIISAYKAATA